LLSIDAFEQYYRDLQPGLLRFIGARVRDRHAARDVLQEVYTKAFRNLERYDEKRPFSTWIYTIARNACVDHLRRRVRDPLSPGPAAPAEPPDRDGMPSRLDDDPQRAALDKDLLVEIRRELARLPDHRRAAVEMKIVEGLTYREIGEVLGVPLGTVAFWVRDALDTVSRRLDHLR